MRVGSSRVGETQYSSLFFLTVIHCFTDICLQLRNSVETCADHTGAEPDKPLQGCFNDQGTFFCVVVVCRTVMI